MKVYQLFKSRSHATTKISSRKIIKNKRKTN